MKQEGFNLLESLRVDIDAGTIYFKNRRMIILNAEALGLIRVKLVELVGEFHTGYLLWHFGYANGYQDGLLQKERFQPHEQREWLLAGAHLAASEGFASVNLNLIEFDAKKNSFEVEATWVNSFDVDQVLQQFGVPDMPICSTTVGYLSGYASAVMNNDIMYIEKECVACGDARCYAVGKMEWDEESEEIQRIQNWLKDAGVELTTNMVRTDIAEVRRLIEELEQQHQKARTLESQVYYLQEAIKQDYSGEMIGNSPALNKVIKNARTVATSDTTVLIQGETGTGKELMARFIYSHSLRSRRPFITVNCAALPAGLVESELFGHEKGAFTGAIQRKLGRFEIANGATIFLDEIGDLPLETQAKLLRVLQQGEFERVGGTQSIKVDVRVLAATNQPLDELVQEGKFRADLFYRLNAFPLILPPLRERSEDITLLVNYFAQKYRTRFRKNIISINQTSLENLQNYSWPGNVRELEHIIERAVLLAKGEVLEIDLPLNKSANTDATNTDTANNNRLVSMEEMERNYIKEVLQHTRGVIAGKGGAAEILGLPPSTLRSRMKRLGLK